MLRVEELSNCGHIRKAVLNAQKSAEAIVPQEKRGKGGTNTSRSNGRKENSMKKAENATKSGCPQRDSTECEEYEGVRSAVRLETGETAGRQPDLLEQILDRDNLNNAYKRVKANKGAPGVDG